MQSCLWDRRFGGVRQVRPFLVLGWALGTFRPHGTQSRAWAARPWENTIRLQAGPLSPQPIVTDPRKCSAKTGAKARQGSRLCQGHLGADCETEQKLRLGLSTVVATRYGYAVWIGRSGPPASKG